MKCVRLIALLSSVILLCNGCLLTLYPIYTTDDIDYDAKIPGLYRSQITDQPGVLKITNLESASLQLPPKVRNIAKSGYHLQYQDHAGRPLADYAAFIVKLSGKKYIDLFPLSGRFGRDEFYKAITIPMHAVYQFESDSSGVSLLPMDQDFLEECVRRKELTIKNEASVADRDVTVKIITAGTKDLQAYINKYGNNAEAYDQREKQVYKKIAE